VVARQRNGEREMFFSTFALKNGERENDGRVWVWERASSSPSSVFSSAMAFVPVIEFLKAGERGSCCGGENRGEEKFVSLPFLSFLTLSAPSVLKKRTVLAVLQCSLSLLLFVPLCQGS